MDNVIEILLILVQLRAPNSLCRRIEELIIFLSFKNVITKKDNETPADAYAVRAEMAKSNARDSSVLKVKTIAIHEV